MASLNLTTPGGASAQVCLHGATVTSYQVGGEEVLFVSEQAVFDEASPIRGGIPIVFPQFGPGPLTSHGFARRFAWAVADAGESRAVFALDQDALSDEWRQSWPHSFALQYTVTLAEDSLETRLRVTNTGDAPFSSQALLHTYYRANATEARVDRLEGCAVTDKLTGTEGQQPAGGVAVAGELDSIFRATPRQLALSLGGGRGVDLEQWFSACAAPSGLEVDASGLEVEAPSEVDTVVWNPWVDKAARMSDFGDEEYRGMLCVEPGRVHSPAELAPGASYELVQVLRPVSRL